LRAARNQKNKTRRARTIISNNLFSNNLFDFYLYQEIDPIDVENLLRSYLAGIAIEVIMSDYKSNYVIMLLIIINDEC